MTENNFPFKINFLKQTERFQVIEQLDQQFEKMLEDWRKGAFKKEGLSEKLNINYPTWEIEKKILLWTALHHKHLGSPVKTSHLGTGDFRKDIHASEAEIEFAGKENVLKNLVARGFASWNEGSLISKEGLELGLLIAELYKFIPANSIEGEGKEYRDEKLVFKPFKYWGYKLLYYTSLLVIFFSLFLLSFTFINQLGIDFAGDLPARIQNFVMVFSFVPIIIFAIAFILLHF